MKYAVIAILLAMLVLLCLAGCRRTAPAAEEEAVYTGLANPFVTYDTLEAAADAAGFSLTVPDAVDGYDERIVQVMSGKMLQVIYRNGDSRLFVRKAAGDGDISGDYNSYSNVRSQDIDGRRVTLKGDGETVKTARWTADGYSYAVMADEAMRAAKMTALIGQIG